MAEDKDTGLDFEALKRLAAAHDTAIRLRTRDGRIIDITKDTLPEALLGNAAKVSVDNHDRVGVRTDTHDRVTNIHDRAGRAVDLVTDPGRDWVINPGRDFDHTSGGVFLSGLTEQQVAELRDKASDLLQGKQITIFKK